MSPAFLALILVVLTAIGAALFLLERRNHERSCENLRAVADRLGLRLVVPERRLWIIQPVPRVEGRAQDVEVSIATVTFDDDSRRWTRVHVPLPTALHFRIARAGTLSRLFHGLGRESAGLGDARVDAELHAESDDVARLHALFGSERRQALLEMLRASSYGILELDAHGLVYREQGGFADRARCERLRDAAALLIVVATDVLRQERALAAGRRAA